MHQLENTQTGASKRIWTENDNSWVDIEQAWNGGDNSRWYCDWWLDGKAESTPASRGREWRKAIYRKIGIINIRDQAMAA